MNKATEMNTRAHNRCSFKHSVEQRINIMLTFIKDPLNSYTSAFTLTTSQAVEAPTHPLSQMTVLQHREVK